MLIMTNLKHSCLVFRNREHYNSKVIFPVGFDEITAIIKKDYVITTRTDMDATKYANELEKEDLCIFYPTLIMIN